MLKKQSNTVSVIVETSTECDVNNMVKERVEKAIQNVVDQCSKEFYRSITVETNINLV